MGSIRPSKSPLSETSLSAATTSARCAWPRRSLRVSSGWPKQKNTHTRIHKYRHIHIHESSDFSSKGKIRFDVWAGTAKHATAAANDARRWLGEGGLGGGQQGPRGAQHERGVFKAVRVGGESACGCLHHRQADLPETALFQRKMVCYNSEYSWMAQQNSTARAAAARSSVRRRFRRRRRRQAQQQLQGEQNLQGGPWNAHTQRAPPTLGRTTVHPEVAPTSSATHNWKCIKNQESGKDHHHHRHHHLHTLNNNHGRKNPHLAPVEYVLTSGRLDLLRAHLLQVRKDWSRCPRRGGLSNAAPSSSLVGVSSSRIFGLSFAAGSAVAAAVASPASFSSPSSSSPPSAAAPVVPSVATRHTPPPYPPPPFDGSRTAIGFVGWFRYWDERCRC